MKMQNMKLNTLAGGAVQEHFERELSRVVDNLTDLSTDPKKKRKITLTLDLTTNDNRDYIAVDVQAKSTLTPTNATEFALMTGVSDKGNREVAELKSGAKGQSFIDDDGDLKNDDGSELIKKEDGKKVSKLYK